MSDLSPEAEALLKRARVSFSPGEARTVALRAAIAAKVGPALPGRAPATEAAAKIAGAGTATKLAIVGALALLSATGARMLAAPTHTGSLVAVTPTVIPRAPALPFAPQAAEPGQPQGTPSIAVDDLPPARSDRTRPPRSALPPTEVRAPQAHPSSIDERASAPTASTALEPAVLPGPHDHGASAESAAVVSMPRISTPGAADPSLRDEVALLRAAHLALDHGDAAGALALLDRYAQAYPAGTMEEEALATRVLTLCALGRVTAAKDVARHLESIAPRSPHLARMRASCAGGEDPSE